MSTEPTVFVVDDEPSVRESIAALVEPMGVASELFASAEEFLAAYDPSRPGCLVTDVRMMGMSGLELQEQLQVRDIKIPVIIISAYADVPIAVDAMQKGAVTLLEKPCRDQELWDAICRAIARDAAERDKATSRQEILDRLAELTPSEREVMDLMVAGLPNKVIAKRLDVGLRTVETRRHNIFQKLKAKSLADVVRCYLLAQGEEAGQ